MKRLVLCAAIAFIAPAFTSFSNKIPVKQQADLQWLKQWFEAWDLVRGKVLMLPEAPPPEMLFYDDTYVYTTSVVSAPEGSPVNGPAFSGKKLAWRKMPHKGQLTLPDGQKVPLGLMSFAGPAGNGKSFFVMAAPSFWEAAGVKSELGLGNMLTGVFLHEFAHVRQFEGFGARVDAIEKTHAFGDVSVSDDIVQDLFKKDSTYVREFQSEVNKLYEAAFASSKEQVSSLAKEALGMLQRRHAKYFTGDKAILSELDNIFLSMEGLGQYVAVAWLVHPRGGNIPFNTAIEGFRRKRNQWSQEEGLALFLVLTRLSNPDWNKTMFSKEPVSVLELLNKL